MLIEELRLQNDRRLAMVMLALFLVPSLWYLQTDFTLFAGDWDRLAPRLWARGAMMTATVVGLILLALVRVRSTYSWLVFGIALALVAPLLGLNAMRPENSDLPLRSPLFTIAVMYGLLPNTTIRQVVPPLLLSAGLALLRVTWLSSSAVTDVAGDLIILLVLNTAGLLMVLRRRALERALDQAWQSQLEARLASERALADLRTLHGIIPICSFCKKVRTEVGNWQQIERYVQHHTQAEFSHGLCPDCRDHHYPDLAPGQAS